MRRLIWIPFSAVLAAAASAQAPLGMFFIGSDQFEVSLAELSPGVFGLTGPVTFSNDEASVTITNLVMDSDPFIAYGLSVTDLGAPSNFSFTFSTPIVTIGSPNTVAGSLVGGLNDVTGNGVSITATAGPNVQRSEVGAATTNMGVDVGPSASFGPGLPGAQYAYGSFNAGPQTGPVGTWTTLTAHADFGLSGDADIAVLTGFASIVPEPATMAILGIGAFGMLARRRRK